MTLTLPFIASRITTFNPVSFPRTIIKMQGLLDNQNATAEVIVNVLVTDPLLCAGVIGQASALQPCLSAAHAVSSLGLEAVQGILRETEPVPIGTRHMLASWSDEANATAFMTRLVVRYLVGKRRIPALRGLDDEGLRLIGLTHNLGTAVAMVAFTPQYLAAAKASAAEPFRLRLQETIGVSSGDLGYMLAKQWRLPELIAQINRHVHHPLELDAELALPAAAVHVARTLVRAVGQVAGHDKYLDELQSGALDLLHMRSTECEGLLLQFVDLWDEQEDYEPGGGVSP